MTISRRGFLRSIGLTTCTVLLGSLTKIIPVERPLLLPCDGRWLSEAEYPELAAKLKGVFDCTWLKDGKFRLPSLEPANWVLKPGIRNGFDAFGLHLPDRPVVALEHVIVVRSFDEDKRSPGFDAVGQIIVRTKEG